MDEVIISFCIPSYNRSKLTFSLVKSILEYPNKDIEVVVVDNCSTDTTVVDLKKVNDDRLRVRVNEKNLGAAGNFIESLKYSKGEYSFVALSRDLILSTTITNLISVLKEKNYSVVYCGEDKKNKENIEYKKGYEGFLNVSYKNLHPTGFIFNTNELNKISKDINSEQSKEKYLNFPHDFLAAELSFKGNVLFYNKVIRQRVTNTYLSSNKSSFSDDNKVWFFPQELIKQFDKCVEHLSNLKLNKKVYMLMLRKLYFRLLYFSTIIYASYRRNEAKCIHYGINTKIITNADERKIVKSIKRHMYKNQKYKKIEVDFKTKMLICLSYEVLLLCKYARKMKRIIKSEKVE